MENETYFEEIVFKDYTNLQPDGFDPEKLFLVKIPPKG
jgi:hypothetical protein